MGREVREQNDAGSRFAKLLAQLVLIGILTEQARNLIRDMLTVVRNNEVVEARCPEAELSAANVESELQQASNKAAMQEAA